MSIRKHWKVGAVAVSCAGIGVGAGAIANAGASGGSKRTSTPAGATASASSARARGKRALIRRAVQGNVVVATRTGYGTVTFNRGTVKSVSGQQLTLTDGRTGASAYKTVTLTIPSTAHVRDDRQQARLGDVKAGQRAIVIQAPKRTIVIARSAP